jgi:hypothetical protein
MNSYCNEVTFPIIPTENSYVFLDFFPFRELSKAHIFMHVFICSRCPLTCTWEKIVTLCLHVCVHANMCAYMYICICVCVCVFCYMESKWLVVFWKFLPYLATLVLMCLKDNKYCKYAVSWSIESVYILVQLLRLSNISVVIYWKWTKEYGINFKISSRESEQRHENSGSQAHCCQSFVLFSV